MKECKTSPIDKAIVVIITAILGAFSVISLIVIVANDQVEIYTIVGVLLFVWITMIGINRISMGKRRLLFDEERIIVEISKGKQKEFRWDEMDLSNIEFVDKTILLYETNTKVMSIFGGSLGRTKRTLLMKINHRTTNSGPFLEMLREKSPKVRRSQTPLEDIFGEFLEAMAIECS